MIAKPLIATLFAAALFVAAPGCDDKKPTPKVDDTKPAMPTADAMKEKAAAAADATRDAAAKAMEKTKEGAVKVADVAKDTTAKMVDSTKNATSGAADKAKAAAANAPGTVADAAAAGNDKAADWMNRLEDAIKANRLDEAKTYTDKLDAIQANLPDALRDRYAALKKSLDEARAKVATQLNK
jgi:hypothetical protein